MGAREYHPTDEPRDIIDQLTRRYGDKTPAEVEWLNTEWRKEWNPADPIEELIDRLEECFIFATYMGPAFTDEHLIERAHMQVKKTGLFQMAVVEWEGFTAENKTWPEWKSHFIEAYELCETSGLTTSAIGYHGVANAANDNDTDSICASINNM